MKDSEKNRDPAKAVQRAGADARCALRKLELLEGCSAMAEDIIDTYSHEGGGNATRYLLRIAREFLAKVGTP